MSGCDVTEGCGQTPRIGVKRRLFGAVLLCVAALEFLLDVKTGGGPDYLVYALFTAGGIFIASGLIKRTGRV